MQKVVDTVKSNINNPVTVNLLRKNIIMGTIKDIEISYVPREWQGAGFLGCVLKVTPV